MVCRGGSPDSASRRGQAPAPRWDKEGLETALLMPLKEPMTSARNGELHGQLIRDASLLSCALRSRGASGEHGMSHIQSASPYYSRYSSDDVTCAIELKLRYRTDELLVHQ